MLTGLTAVVGCLCTSERKLVRRALKQALFTTLGNTLSLGPRVAICPRYSHSWVKRNSALHRAVDNPT